MFRGLCRKGKQKRGISSAANAQILAIDEYIGGIFHAEKTEGQFLIFGQTGQGDAGAEPAGLFGDGEPDLPGSFVPDTGDGNGGPFRAGQGIAIGRPIDLAPGGLGFKAPIREQKGLVYGQIH